MRTYQRDIIVTPGAKTLTSLGKERRPYADNVIRAHTALEINAV